MTKKGGRKKKQTSASESESQDASKQSSDAQQQYAAQTGSQQQQHATQAAPQQQQHATQAAPQQQTRATQAAPQQQQQRPQRPPQQPQGPWQQQQRPQGPPQQPQGPWQQQQRPLGPPQQQQHPSGPPQQPQGSWQQQQRPQGPPQQQQRPPGPPQQQQRPPGPPQQQQRPQGPPQQPQGPWQQQQRPQGPPQQPQGPWQQQQRPRGPPQQQQHPSGPPQQPQGPWQQQQRLQGPPQQQQRPPGPPQQQQRPPGPPQQQQRPPSLPQQQQRPPGPPQQQQHPPGSAQQTSSSSISSQDSATLSPAISQQVIIEKSAMKSSLAATYFKQIPKRSVLSRGGTQGIPIKVETNMFKLIFNKNFQTSVSHYNVTMDPDKPKMLLRPVFEAFRKKACPNRYPAFDGRKSAYSAQDLPFGDFIAEEVTIFDPERQQQRNYKIQLKKVAEIDLSWLKNIRLGMDETEKEHTSIQALDVILRHGPASQYITVGRSLFMEPEPGRVVSLSNGLDLWVGVFQSAVVGWKPYLNVDVAHKGFPTPQCVLDLMKELCKNPRDRYDSGPRELNAADVNRNADRIQKFLKSLKVQYEIPGEPSSRRTHRVNGLGESPKQHKFTLSPNQTTITVLQYYAKEKRYNIRYPDIPCLWVGPREKKIYVPAELCKIVAGQVTQKKMDESQTSTMIRYAATGTDMRKDKIMKGLHNMNLNANPVLTKEFNLSVQGQFETVPARVLKPPMLKYDRQDVSVSKGVWRAGRFLQAVKLPPESWTILNINERTQERDLYALHDELQRGGRSVNMEIGKAQTPFVSLSVRGRDVRQILDYFKTKKEQGLQLVVVVIPDMVEAYSRVKQITELQVGLLTQCLKANTLRKLSPPTVQNILLKINSKLNGVNHNLLPNFRPPCLDTPCMLVGADVTHPSPDATDIPSIAAVAASHDPNAFQYNIEIRFQPPREEIILDLENIMYSQLLFFYKKSGQKPMRVIFYRDGVSEGQLPHVMHFELSAIKKAFKRLSPSGEYNPPVTFLVVQKRHHIRLFPTDKRFSDDKNFNVQAGTIVDTEITHASHIDFYLVSHASIQGTARPTKYRCICNENQLTEDEIEQLTYHLCHMFARCTRSVSYPAPTYYAHLAAFRARALTHDVPLRLDRLAEEQRTKMNLQINRTTPMFFV